LLGAGARSWVEFVKSPFWPVLAICGLPAAAAAAPPPEPIRAMIETALATDDPATIASVVGVAKHTVPESAAEIDAIVAGYSAKPAAKKAAAPPPPPVRAAAAQLWKGSVELGGSHSTGNSRVLDVYGGVDLTRTGPRWTHKITAHVEYQETSGATSAERLLAAYQPQLKLDADHYAYGLAQYEHDRFLGYRNRYTVGAGLGLSAVTRPDLKIEFDAGPAARRTSFYDHRPGEDRLAARGSFHLKWLPSPRLTISEEAALYLQRGDTTAKSLTALETRLFGPLKARLSYEAQYESAAPDRQKDLDTTSRVSLVYGF
jgi:putative salt-induced outer membrane protein